MQTGSKTEILNTMACYHQPVKNGLIWISVSHYHQSHGINTILTVIKYSHFPFVSATVIDCLDRILHIFGTLMYIHSDRGMSFM